MPYIGAWKRPGVGALIIVPIACAVYNLAAKLVGGIEVSVADAG